MSYCFLFITLYLSISKPCNREIVYLQKKAITIKKSIMFKEIDSLFLRDLCFMIKRETIIKIIQKYLQPKKNKINQK